MLLMISAYKLVALTSSTAHDELCYMNAQSVLIALLLVHISGQEW